MQPTLASETNTLTCEQCCSRNPLMDTRLEAGYSWGQFIGIKEDYAELGLFVPVTFCDRWAIFADGRAYRFEDDQWGASAGIGFRGFTCDGRIFGANFYYDYLEGTNNGYFNRLGVGLEWLGPCWDLRVNGYLPVGDETQVINMYTLCIYPETGDFFKHSLRSPQ